MKRRELIVGGIALGMGSLVAHAGPPTDVEARRLANRLELWGTFARRTESLVARYNGRRESSLLFEPLVSSGAMAFVAPATLVFRDDGLTGSNTRLEGGDVSIRPNEGSVPQGPAIRPSELPALGWLRDRLLALFNPGDGSALTADSRVLVPRSRKPRLQLLPPLDSVERKLVRSLTITFDPVGGAVLEIDLQEAQGDRFRLSLADHRQNPSESELERVL
jgi:hypothetical protein